MLGAASILDHLWYRFTEIESISRLRFILSHHTARNLFPILGSSYLQNTFFQKPYTNPERKREGEEESSVFSSTSESNLVLVFERNEYEILNRSQSN